MMFPFVEYEEESMAPQEYHLKEYGVDFQTGQLTGRTVEGLEALKVWVWLALQTQLNRYYIYSGQYGHEIEELIGKGFSRAYMASELQRVIEECLLVSLYITGVEDFECGFKNEKVYARFKISTIFGDEEVNMRV